MNEALYERKGSEIKDLSNDSVTKHNSINKAKKASVDLQKSNDAGKTGLGSVRVAK